MQQGQDIVKKRVSIVSLQGWDRVVVMKETTNKYKGYQELPGRIGLQL